MLAPKLRFLETVPRNRWLSFAGGVSIAYVFVHILPDLGHAQRRLERAGVVEFLESHAYLVALLGLYAFYGLEHLAIRSRAGNQNQTAPAVFWVHIGSYGAYNALIGYLLLHREESDTGSLVFFAIAIGLHFLVNDFGLQEHHKERYRRARWLLSGAVLVGWVCGLLIDLEGAAVDVLFAFLAGAIIINVIKEEIPNERQSRFLAFALGAIAYSALLLLG